MNLSRSNSVHLAAALLAGSAVLGVAACGSGAGSSSAGPATSAPPAASASANSAASPPAGSAPAAAPSPSAAQSPATIHIKSFDYTGPDTVPAGATVTVMNMDSEAHTVTAEDGSFDAVVKGGESVTFTAPVKPGTYAYHCTYHSNMQGTLTVK
ncbi:cupredoxin domain-containing protein [Arthrobacter sp. UYEF20]|uniref:cupredoxin domain-containing protein n=1 Tax=Arthrobacter sp. UYEF20 TaxID=1756363 RepID=UPI003393E4A6